MWVELCSSGKFPTDNNVETEANADMALGATYGMGDYTLFVEYASEGNTADQDASTTITVGAAKARKLQVEHLYFTM